MNMKKYKILIGLSGILFATCAAAGDAGRVESADLILSDLGPLENRLGRLVQEPGQPGEKTLLEKCIAHMEGEQPLVTLGLDEAELALLTGFGLLSNKPVLVLLN